MSVIIGGRNRVAQMDYSPTQENWKNKRQNLDLPIGYDDEHNKGSKETTICCARFLRVAGYD